MGALEFKQTQLHVKRSEGIELKLSDEEIVKACNAISGLLQSTIEKNRELRRTVTEEKRSSGNFDE